MDFHVSKKDIEQALKEINSFLIPTPLVYNRWLSGMYQCKIYLKLENFQPIGSFKIRGALHKLKSLSSKEREKGVIAASAGNHAQGVALAAKWLQIRSAVVMPENASLVKIENTKSLGAQVILKGKTYDEAYCFAQEKAKKENCHFVHAFEDPKIIAGQGTLGYEILKTLPDVEVVIGAVGGGGLMSGIGTVFLNTSVECIGVQAQGASALWKAFQKNRVQESDTCSPHTIADGISVGRASKQMYALLKERLQEIGRVSDTEICTAILHLLERASILVEGAAAVPLAFLNQHFKQNKNRFFGKKVVLIISGGNLDLNFLDHVLKKGLLEVGRRLCVRVRVQDEPGSLLKLIQIIAKEGGNVLQVIHRRDEAKLPLGQTEIIFKLETRSKEHLKNMLFQLKKQAIEVEDLET